MSREIPVLLTVPCRVIASPAAARGSAAERRLLQRRVAGPEHRHATSRRRAIILPPSRMTTDCARPRLAAGRRRRRDDRSNARSAAATWPPPSGSPSGSLEPDLVAPRDAPTPRAGRRGRGLCRDCAAPLPRRPRTTCGRHERRRWRRGRGDPAHAGAHRAPSTSTAAAASPSRSSTPASTRTRTSWSRRTASSSYVDITNARRRREDIERPDDSSWHGMMTSVVACGNGHLSERLLPRRRLRGAARAGEGRPHEPHPARQHPPRPRLGGAATASATASAS